MQPHGGGWAAIILPVVIFAVALGFRLRSMSKERPLKVETLWVIPVVYLLLAASMLYAMVPPPVGWGLLLAGLAVGLVLGWHRGKLIRIDRDPATGVLRQKASPLATFLLLALIVLKLGARAIFGEAAAGQPDSNAMLLADAFIGFALGLLSATRLELYIRGRRILANG